MTHSLVAMLVVLTALLGGCAPAAAAGRDVAEPRRETLVHGGRTRSYFLHVPDAVLRSAQRVPLVIDLHGGGGNGRIAAAMTGFTAKAEREGFIVVYPNGTGPREDILLTWNAGGCCAHAMINGVDDVGFIAALIDKLVRERPVDSRRVYVTGMSNGAMMAHRLAIALPDRIAAIAPVVGALFGDERPPRGPVAALIINGALDRAVPVDGGTLGGRAQRAAASAPLLPAAAQDAFWARANGCTGAPREEMLGAAVRVWRHACPAGRDVVRYLVLDGGHAWPGGRAGTRGADRPATSIDATDVIWSFFRTKALAPR